jgi:hypothetical protein
MLIINKQTPKRTKLHIKVCPICGIEFGSYRNTSKTCSSKDCWYKLSGMMVSRTTYRQCVICGKDFPHRPSEDSKGSIHTFCSMSCMNANKKLGLPFRQYLAYDGYIVMSATDDGRKQIKLHRYLMEQFIGRKLLPREIVHHINNNKLDNRIENLKMMSRSEHNIVHKFLRR